MIDPHKSKYDQQAIPLDFTEQDLAINRQGDLTPNQYQNLLRQRDYYQIDIGFITLAGGIITVILAILLKEWTWLLIGGSIAIFGGILAWINRQARLALKSASRNKAVKVVSGPFNKPILIRVRRIERMCHKIRTRRADQVYFYFEGSIAKEVLQFSACQYAYLIRQTVQHPQRHYHFYYLPIGPKSYVLSFEPISLTREELFNG